MATAARLDAIRSTLASWAAGQADVVAVALLGSWARGTARPDSDVDVLVLTSDPASRRLHPEWTQVLGPTRSIAHEEYGVVHSLRVCYDADLEVEFAIAPLAWAELARSDPGTMAVARAGLVRWYDPDGLLRIESTGAV